MFIQFTSALGSMILNVDEIRAISISSNGIIIYTLGGKPYTGYDLAAEDAKAFLDELSSLTNQVNFEYPF